MPGGSSFEAPCREVTRRLSELGALLPAVATLDPAALVERLSDPSLERVIGPKDLITCPYCKSAKRKGLIDIALRTRLPSGMGSEIAAWAADFAASGGFAIDSEGGGASVVD